jgi:hypothetical protein
MNLMLQYYLTIEIFIDNLYHEVKNYFEPLIKSYKNTSKCWTNTNWGEAQLEFKKKININLQNYEKKRVISLTINVWRSFFH